MTRHLSPPGEHVAAGDPLAAVAEQQVAVLHAIEWAPPWAVGVVLVVAWVVPGVAAAVAMGRRGHVLRAVLGLGIVLGPLYVPLARHHLRRRDPATRPVVVVEGATGGDHRTVVVLDAAPQRVADARPVIERLRDPGRVILAVPVGYSTLRGPEHDADRRAAVRRLHDAATLLGDLDPTLVLAPGTVEDVARTLASRPADVVVLVPEVADARSNGAPGPLRVLAHATWNA